ncbi:hypothetical protein ERJ75_000035600 [Trypanosoma vivax]|uniref:Uncharacterized protein n=1 Tax=Trypanosoma vivax (strain Y486) TaxID=1055687 RepID=G0U7U0_TRYVY|nr:hypothetical protein TRVL_00421 [Trypanosoma vivax]KAH8620569.1 hypothetical protein ERJ75_000035600 [Trypanosoma vivax]CCC51948.1 hypothetical protein TVY486_1009930 [Trypanosoma vivax Y486]
MNIHVSGNVEGSTVVLLAGFPDTSQVFHGNIMTELAPHHRLVGMSFPGFDTQALKLIINCEGVSDKVTDALRQEATSNPLLGYSFEVLVDMFEIALFAVMEGRTWDKPMLIAHSLGCTVAYEFMLLRPYFFHRVVILDVGCPVAWARDSRSDKYGCSGPADNFLSYSSWSCILFVFLCQVLLLFSFILPKFMGKRILHLMLYIFRRPKYNYISQTVLRDEHVDDTRELWLASSNTFKGYHSQHSRGWRVTDIVDGVMALVPVRLGGYGLTNCISVAFYPAQFYHAKSRAHQTLPPRPDATGISYSCFKYSCASVRDNLLKSAASLTSCSTPSMAAKIKSVLSRSFPHGPLINNFKRIFQVESEANADVAEGDPACVWVLLRLWVFLFSQFLSSSRFIIPIQVPVLFLYGTEKPVMLHSERWIKHIQERGKVDNSKVIPIPGGHWFFAEEKNKFEVANHVREFLNVEDSPSPT